MIRFTREYEEIGITSPVWQDCRAIVDSAAARVPSGRVVIHNDIPAGREVFADPLIVKVFYNLADNAVRYGQKITAIRFSLAEQDGKAVIVCEDDGVGVPAGDKERIFEKGFGKNTGLGLALSREILDITGITIKETGTPGAGARFELAVPPGTAGLPALIKCRRDRAGLFHFHDEGDFHINAVFDNLVVLHLCRAVLDIDAPDIPDGFRCCFHGIFGCFFPAVG